MAQIDKPNLHFNTVTYTGTGSAQSITGVGFQPDFIWGKNRSTTNYHDLEDSVRGATKRLSSNVTDVEATETVNFTSFDSDGFSVGTGANVNGNGNNIVAWNWKAGTTGSGNTSGSGTSRPYSYSVNTTAGFSIVGYKGNGTSGHTIPHHLGETPSVIIIKNRSYARNWSMYHKDSFVSQSDPGVLYLNTDAGKASDTNVFGNSSVTINSTVFSLGDYEGTNRDDDNLISYCFVEKTGYSKFGGYKGNGSSDGTFVYTGFKPAWVLTKAISRTGRWRVWDIKRSTFNVANKRLDPSSSDAESTGSTEAIDMLSNGFKIRTNEGQFNGSGESHIYMAFAENPIVGSNDVPATAR